MRRPFTILFATVMILLLGGSIAMAGGGGHGGQACLGFGDGQEILMRDSCFEGTGHVVAAGQTITVTNAGQLPHSLTAVDGSFDSGIVESGETYQFTISESGVVPVYCTLHGGTGGSGMAGLLAVQAAADLSEVETASSTTPRGSWWPWIAVVALMLAMGATLVRGRRVA